MIRGGVGDSVLAPSNSQHRKCGGLSASFWFFKATHFQKTPEFNGDYKKTSSNNFNIRDLFNTTHV